MPFPPHRPARTRTETLRGLRAHALVWDGDPVYPLRVLLHGEDGAAASFQGLAERFQANAGVVAIDWRGHGRSAAGTPEGCSFSDFLGDLDAWLTRLSPTAAVDLVAEGLGADIAMVYAGVRPQRVRRLVNLEGFGQPDTPPDLTPRRLSLWLDALEQPAGLPQRRVQALLLQRAELLACWQRIAAPVLFVEGQGERLRSVWGGGYPRADLEAALALVPRLQRASLPLADSPLQEEAPQELAALVDEFLYTRVPLAGASRRWLTEPLES